MKSGQNLAKQFAILAPTGLSEGGQGGLGALGGKSQEKVPSQVKVWEKMHKFVRGNRLGNRNSSGGAIKMKFIL